MRIAVSDDYAIQAVDYLIGIQSDSLDGPMTLQLPLATDLLNGQTFIVKDEGGSVDTYPVTVICSGSDTIDGQNQMVLQSPHSSVSIYCNGINKYFIY
jgi:hypothetical protein